MISPKTVGVLYGQRLESKYSYQPQNLLRRQDLLIVGFTLWKVTKYWLQLDFCSWMEKMSLCLWRYCRVGWWSRALIEYLGDVFSASVKVKSR